MEEFYSKSQNETICIASKFALSLKMGDVVLLDGDLGAGKTVFAKGIVGKLSNNKIVAVYPTFVIMNEYETNPKVYHFDLYRVSDESELDAIGAEEYIYSDAISLIEWPSRAKNYFPKTAIKVYIKKISDEERIIQIER